MWGGQEVEDQNHFREEKDVPSGNAKQVHRIISNLIITSSTRMKEDIYHDYLDKDLSGDSVPQDDDIEGEKKEEAAKNEATSHQSGKAKADKSEEDRIVNGYQSGEVKYDHASKCLAFKLIYCFIYCYDLIHSLLYVSMNIE